MIRNPVKTRFFERARDILGMNARNLHYIGRYNSSAHKKFADDKLFTKNYLGTRNIGAAKLYAVISNHKRLHELDPETLPERFVVKPNRGYGGEGILVVGERKGRRFKSISGRDISYKELYRHIVSILDGKYAISGRSDQAIFEELLEPVDYFKQFCEFGLPDVRVIVFNYVPVIAMLRLPTEESHGKANLHMGAVGIGIDISSGQATYAVQHGKSVRRLPNGERISQIHVPYWNEVLLTASKAQHASQIGFLAVDLAVTKTGVKVLELNARAGLALQIANRVPLKRRLNKVSDLVVPTPEKGVEISKTLFSKNSETEKEGQGRPVIGLFEHVSILNTKYDAVPAKIDLHADSVVVDASLLDPTWKYVDVQLKGQRLRLPFRTDSFEGLDHKIVLPGKYLKDFLIDPSVEKSAPLAHKKKSTVDEKILKNLDKKIYEVEASLNVLSYIKPLNLVEEERQFLRNPIASPRFIYRKLPDNLSIIEKDLTAFPKQIDHPLAPLYEKKVQELLQRIELLRSIDTPKLQTYSQHMYGKVDTELYNRARSYIENAHVKEDDSELLTVKQVVKRLETYLKENSLPRWSVKLSERQTADIAISKQGSVLVKKDISFTENRLQAVIAHEIETHAFRLENGKRQQLRIFERGTAGYLTTEEGLAVYNQKRLGIPMGEKEIWPALRVVGIYLSDDMTFAELFHYLKDEMSLSDQTSWKTCLKAKRGLIDTNKKIAFTRDSVYFRGYMHVQEFLKNGGELHELYVGKIAIPDLRILRELQLRRPRFLPRY